MRTFRSSQVRCRSVVAAGLAFALSVTGCSLSPDDLPSVRSGVHADYSVTIRFENVMNLPAGADVLLDGLRVGQVQGLTATPDGIDVMVGLAADTRVAADAGAIIRQNTLLGDTYIALIPNSDPRSEQGFLGAGSTVPLERTTSPPQLEDTIAVLAYFVNGGSIQKMQDTMATLNRTMPELEDVRRMAGTVALDMADLAEGTAELDRLLNGVNDTATAVNDRSAEWQAVFGEQGTYYWHNVARAVVAHISTLLPSVGSIFEGGLWLTPMLNSLADTAESGRGIWDDAPATTVRVNNFLRTTLLPFAQRPAVNVTSVGTGSGDELIGDVTSILRLLGAVR
ncbi:MlaD family protein [Nocardia shimofusensis]|uniref:MlaD family protein n=1 Tax=Nocardia shimofusensis TaxID=228596 RepID=UPI000B2100AF|nr:MlaD family protein [Nocardia shimofusensis]